MHVRLDETGSSHARHFAALQAWKAANGVNPHPAEHVECNSILAMLGSFSTAPTFFGGGNQSATQITPEAETSFDGANVSAVHSAAIAPSFAHHQMTHVEAMAECSVQLTKNCARVEFLKGRFDSSAQIMARLAM